MTNKLRSVMLLGFTTLLLSSCSPAKDNCTKYVNATDVKLLNNHWFSDDEYLITYEDGSIQVTKYPWHDSVKCVAREKLSTL